MSDQSILNLRSFFFSFFFCCAPALCTMHWMWQSHALYVTFICRLADASLAFPGKHYFVRSNDCRECYVAIGQIISYNLFRECLGRPTRAMTSKQSQSFYNHRIYRRTCMHLHVEVGLLLIVILCNIKRPINNPVVPFMAELCTCHFEIFVINIVRIHITF